jgi:hypothetical protein
VNASRNSVLAVLDVAAQAERDGRAVIRIGGKRYERELVRILEDDTLLDAIGAEVDRKYGEPAVGESAVSMAGAAANANFRSLFVISA